MKIYRVGGFVRDHLLGLSPNDNDYVVVGATEEEFVSKFPSAVKVGKHFPVFLVDGSEYAFARTETKVSAGHSGFDVQSGTTVTLEDDLARRDITINSLAMDSNDAVIGSSLAMRDISSRIIRHNSGAFTEDPLRVFRVARLAAQLDGFTVASDTIRSMDKMKSSLSELSAERVFKELEKALKCKNSIVFFEVLKSADCLSYWFPEIKGMIGVAAGPDSGKHEGEVDTFHHTMRVVSGIENDPILKFAGLCHDLGKQLSECPPNHTKHESNGLPLVAAMCSRLKVPSKYRKSAMLFTLQHLRMHKIEEMRGGKACTLLIDVEKGMHKGLRGFLDCSVGDFMTEEQANRIMDRADSIYKVRLPGKHHGRGKVCEGILLQEQVREWNHER